MEFSIELFLTPVAGIAIFNWVRRMGLSGRWSTVVGVPLIMALVYATALYGDVAAVQAGLRGLWVALASMGIWDTAQTVASTPAEHVTARRGLDELDKAGL